MFRHSGADLLLGAWPFRIARGLRVQEAVLAAAWRLDAAVTPAALVLSYATIPATQCAPQSIGSWAHSLNSTGRYGSRACVAAALPSQLWWQAVRPLLVPPPKDGPVED